MSQAKKASELKVSPQPPSKLHGWGLQALDYWKVALPNWVRFLEERGELEQALLEAVERTGNAFQDLVEKKVPAQEAWELVREEWLFPPGEEDLEPNQEGLPAA